jgi:hypothetical protein
MKLQTQVRPNHEDGVSDVHFGLRTIAAGAAGLISILLSIGAAWVSMTNRMAVIEAKTDQQALTRRAEIEQVVAAQDAAANYVRRDEFVTLEKSQDQTLDAALVGIRRDLGFLLEGQHANREILKKVAANHPVPN